MYYEELGFSIPDEEILNIKFLKREEFRPLVFNDKEYIVVGEDDVDNLIGVDVYGKVWFLDTVNEFAMYISKGFKTFIQQLDFFVKWHQPPEDDSEKALKAKIKQFKQEIKKSDKDAMTDREDFWSVIIEQIEDGML